MHYGECRRDIAWDEGQDFKVSVIGRQIIKGYGDGHIMCPSLVFMGQDGSGLTKGHESGIWTPDPGGSISL